VRNHTGADPALTNHIIVDGHNYIFQTGGSHAARDREDLLMKLADYRGLKNVEITVVFDNKSQRTLGIEKICIRGIHVMYGAPHIEADVLINELVEQERNKKRVIVVTTDKAHIGRYCRGMGARVISPQELKELIEKKRLSGLPHVSAEQNEKPASATRAEIDYYLEKFKK
jgi:predicted RNA-binding protein with PIN domain